jgi:hypothetical protein
MNNKAKTSNFKGKKHTKEAIEKNRIAHIGITAWNKGIKTGKHSWNYIKDRTLVKTTDREHKNPRYVEWKKEVHTRDKGKCRISNKDCSGRIEAHHILPWSNFPELRYEVNNGISLCKKHHPRKRKDEKRLIHYFKSLIKI